jgi:hypothetical protein
MVMLRLFGDKQVVCQQQIIKKYQIFKWFLYRQSPFQLPILLKRLQFVHKIETPRKELLADKERA